MSKNPKVAIILPVLNGMPYLKDTLNSLQAQTEEDWQCLIMDRQSQDRSRWTAEDYADNDYHFIFQGSLNCSINSDYQWGVETIKSVYTLFLKVGDRLLPNALEQLVAGLEASPGHVGCYGKVCVRDEHGRALPKTNEDVIGETLRGVRGREVVDWDGPADWNCFLYRNPAPMSSTLFLRWVALEAGGVHPLLEDHLDWDLWLKMSRFGTFNPLHEVVVDVREPEEDPDLARIRRGKAASIVRDEAARQRGLSETQKRLVETLREVGGLLPS